MRTSPYVADTTDELNSHQCKDQFDKIAFYNQLNKHPLSEKTQGMRSFDLFLETNSPMP